MIKALKYWKIGVVFVIIALIFAGIALLREDNTKEETVISNNYSSDKSFRVISVIDGDTLKLSGGKIVRLICVDAPETGKPGYQESKDFLKEIVLNKNVTLEKDVSDTDSYGRLLRYVYLGDIFVNKELVKEGHAKVFRYGNDTKRCNEIAGD